MRFVVDTNKYTDFARNDPDTVIAFRQASEIFFPFIVLGELRSGFQLGGKGLSNERTLISFLNLPGIQVISGDEQTSFFYATIQTGLRKRGTPIPTNDIWIAALTLQHDLILYTRDAHFQLIPEIPKMG